MGSGSEPTLINSVRRALRLMEAVAQSPTPPNATLLASLTGLAPATAYHLLRTLVAEEYLVQTPDHGYALSDRIAEISRQGQPGARQAKIQRALAALRDRANRAVYLAIFEDGSVRLAAVSENHRNRAIDQWISFDEVPHATALGKATLWVMNPSDRVELLAASRLRRLTPNTITTPARLAEEATSGDGGLAVDREEYAPGVACVAVPIMAGGTVGAIAVSMPPRSLRNLGPLPGQLRNAADQVARVLALT